MKIALCQINPTLGAFSFNEEKMLDVYNNAVGQDADLVVFPELAITGYPPQDLLYWDSFIEKNLETLNSIVLKTTVPMIIGYVRRENGNLYNSAALCSNGEIVDSYDKILLPTYDVFDEDRYFTAGTKPGIFQITLKEKLIKIGIQICEDLWDEDYTCKVSSELKNSDAEMIINISASPYREGKSANRRNLISKKVNETELPFVYCNMVGAQDELIFDGSSLAMNAAGVVIACGKAFSEDLVLVDTDNLNPAHTHSMQREEEMYSALVLGVKDYFRKTNHSEAVIGLSGGIDSSLVACIAADALGADQVHGVAMPSKYSSDHSLVDAKALAENLNINFETIPINELVDTYENSLKSVFIGQKPNVTEENIQARARGNILMAMSNKFGWLCLSTGNKTELALGYCTLYGDMSGGLSVISDLSKSDVYALSNWVNRDSERIPNRCITKTPSAELAPGQEDPFNYEIVSPLVDALVEERQSPSSLINDGADADLVNDLANRIRINEYKRRQAATGLRVTRKAFGMGRRIPIVNHFKGD
ncbi:MAG: NAD+ synthase [Candidatus Marinimicrobia bacterium]|nr:NAD+ synthase [Candidatus Neomarinimicrobiota bacterium]MBT3618567.1 NAD+ synthase [Candidatus Neomarinimicrobiota bacterium]MBT3828794.1 NAD+ synthase [Candidatus Neomarinimicrobiota bacterium]MBT3996844.1 NAD+ synthase [Candidatus Neomarinimicrobiota bacterium]MBT4281005.1 NAD+ synthase [Candidatus Neomarinimicrobiota bacterium]